jgi:hypothetical protein
VSRPKLAVVIPGAPPKPPTKDRPEYLRWRRKWLRPPCDCGQPFHRWDSCNQPVCERCYRIEQSMYAPAVSFCGVYERRSAT